MIMAEIEDNLSPNHAPGHSHSDSQTDLPSTPQGRPDGNAAKPASDGWSEKLKSAEIAAQAVAGDKPVDSTIVECPLRKKHWIEIQLLGEDNEGIADEDYLIVTPDNQEFRGKTDAQGLARLDGIEGGMCKICFTNLDQEAWHVI